MYSNYIKSGILILLAGWLVASCTAVPNPEDDSFEGIIISASLDDEVTRTSISKDGSVYNVLWSEGDRISVNGKLSNAVSSEDNGKKGVDFTINDAVSTPYKVLYPGTSSTDVITLPATQNYVANSFDGAAAASFGTATKTGDNKYTAKLTHFCGVLRFALNGTATLDRIVINSLGDEMLSGPFELTVGQGGFTGGFNAGSSASKSVTLSFGSGLTLNSGTDTPIYVAIPAQTYASGLEALVYQSDGAFMRLKFWGDGEPLGRDDIVEFGSKTFAAGRTENLFSINDLAAENGGTPTLTPPTITVATFNTMRMDDDDRPATATTADASGKIARPANAIVKSNKDMQAALGLAIYNMAADVIGFQEIGADSYDTSKTYSIQKMARAQGVLDADYTWDLNWKSGSSYKYCNGFAYRSSVLRLEDSGKVWLRKGSSTYSSSYGSDDDAGSPKRTVVWCLFTHINSGKQFYFFTTQLPTREQDGGEGTSNYNMAGGVNAFAASKGTTLPQILVGDMNCSATHGNAASYNKLMEYWTDAWDVMYDAHEAAGDLSNWYYYKNPGTQTGTQSTFHYTMLQYTKNHGERRLDHIMVHNGTSGSAVVQSYRTVRNKYTVHSNGEDGVADTDDDYDVDCAPSDHMPVVCNITLE